MNAIDSLISVAEGYLGYHEGPNNRTVFGKWFGFENEPWCAMFIAYVADKACLSKEVGRYAYTPSYANWFKSHDNWGTKPERGAIVFFHMPGGANRINHVGIVTKVLPDGRIRTIEGNTSDQVARRTRKAYIVGYGYPDYPVSGTVPPKVIPAPAFPLPAGWWYGPASGGAHAVTGQSGPASYRDGLRTWQKHMLERGWTGLGQADGIYGDNTARVTRQFQQEKHLHVDGEIGLETWKAAWTKPVTT
jgi:peptidoglycan hydrolase-like protein with peptidoglycan-binding domain